MGSRHKSRECALQALYTIDVCKYDWKKIKPNLWVDRDMENIDDDTKQFAITLIEGTLENIKLIDEWISKHSKNWKLDRMASVDRAILRIATFELMKLQENPVNVIIDEAVELSKKFSTADSRKFVNGVLDKVKEIRNVEK